MVYRDKKELITALVHETDKVLDVGFWGQGIRLSNANWTHALILKQAKEVYGTDLEFDENTDCIRKCPKNYLKANAEQFMFQDAIFDTIIASELIEHLSNPGLFLRNCAKHIKSDGILILTTPNCFNLFNIAGKLSRIEPTTNSDHTCYFNSATLTRLLNKNGWSVDEVAYVYTLGIEYNESIKKKCLNMIYRILSLFTPKYLETLVVVARLKNTNRDFKFS